MKAILAGLTLSAVLAGAADAAVLRDRPEFEEMSDARPICEDAPGLCRILDTAPSPSVMLPTGAPLRDEFSLRFFNGVDPRDRFDILRLDPSFFLAESEIASVPAPLALPLMATGLFGLYLGARRRRR